MSAVPPVGRVYSEITTERMEIDQRHAKALQLRIMGATLREIAIALGYEDTHSVDYAIRAALAKINSSPAYLRDLELARLDRMLWSLRTQLEVGEVSAVLAALKIMEARRKLVPGLEAPITNIIAGKEHVTHDMLMKIVTDENAIDIAHRLLEAIPFNTVGDSVSSEQTEQHQLGVSTTSDLSKPYANDASNGAYTASDSADAATSRKE